MKAKLRSILCVLWGHPPTIEYCFGYCICPRCGEQLGDTIGGAYAPGPVVMKHRDPNSYCENCESGKKKMKWHDWLLLPAEWKEIVRNVPTR